MPDNLVAELLAIRTGAAFATINDRAFLRITGSDTTRWLNGMVTNSIQALGPGEGCYNFLLNAQGRIQGDCTIYREPGEEPTFLLETSVDQVDSIHQALEKFIIMDDVEITRGLNIIGHPAVGITMLGERAKNLVHNLISEINEEDEPKPLHVPQEGTETYAELLNKPHSFLWPLFGKLTRPLIIVLAPPPSLAPRSFELWFEESHDRSVLQKLLVKTGAMEVSSEALEANRILSGTPKYGIDIRDRDLPQETNQPHALHFAKGCYLGQEIVERIRSRGQVHRLFTPFRLEGDLPTLPAPLEANGKPAGELTSVAQVGTEIFALGYARREALDTGQTFTYSGGIAVPRSLA